MISIPDLLKERIIFLGEEVNETTASLTVAQLLFSGSRGSEARIFSFTSTAQVVLLLPGMAIYDTMQYISSVMYPPSVWVMAASMGAFLFSRWYDRVRDMALPNAEIMIHQPFRRSTGPGNRD